MRPSRFLLILLVVLINAAVLLVITRIFGFFSTELIVSVTEIWWLTFSGLILLALLDAIRTGPLLAIELTRSIPDNLALGVTNSVSLELYNPLPRLIHIELNEQQPSSLSIIGLPTKLSLKPEAKIKVNYQLAATERGDSVLPPLVARIHSPWCLWQHRTSLGTQKSLKVYPNFTAIASTAELGVKDHIRQLGIHLAQRRGDGLEFNQLREFQEGDALRQVDWKATARHCKPISREYQDERDQEVFFLLDCGRRMRHMEGELSHFDHALNALLLTASIVIRQGDAVGFMSFSGKERWLNPVKGSSAIGILLSQLYDLQSTSQNSDFLQVAESFAQRHQKRSMVVIISNIRKEDNDDLIRATRMLSKRHIVMVASLRENLLDKNIEAPVHTFDEALRYAGTLQFTAERRFTLQRLTAEGAMVVDSSPQHLHEELVSKYFHMKRSQRL
ncbi:MAG: hypothetical protein ACI84K_001735 [Pseudohongiellaceae bacterium]|jgi:uncharacterized protein (DUF58 family)